MNKKPVSTRNISNMDQSIIPLAQLENKHLKHINAAINVALNSDMLHMHGAVMIKGGKVISTGYNSNRTRSFKKNVSSIHAESSALQIVSRQNARRSKERLLCP